jgi:glycine hydroxymethyltransferase
MGNPDTPAKEKAVRKIQHAIFPLTASSTHLGRLPALGIACLEMKVLRAAELASTNRQERPDRRPVPMRERRESPRGTHKGFTRSHQIAVDVRTYGGGNKIAQDLEDANIILKQEPCCPTTTKAAKATLQDCG